MEGGSMEQLALPATLFAIIAVLIGWASYRRGYGDGYSEGMRYRQVQDEVDDAD